MLQKLLTGPVEYLLGKLMFHKINISQIFHFFLIWRRFSDEKNFPTKFGATFGLKMMLYADLNNYLFSTDSPGVR